MKHFITCLTLMPLALTCVSGCATRDAEEVSVREPAAPAAEGRRYLLPAEPKSAVSVISLREEAQDDEEVVVTGRIGGSANPWIEGRAAFSIVDASLQACSDIPGDGCSVPWDYCCVTDRLPDSTALVKVVDDDQNLVQTDARKLLGLEELQTVVLRGKAERDDEGNVTILADGVYVKK